MALVDLWHRSRDQVADKRLHQIIAFAGDGKLKDGSIASTELREYLDAVPSHLLQQYASDCLTGSFENSGLALQEVINQVGERLGFTVEHGRYRGVHGEIGFDGIWRLESGKVLIVEVKTTDAYRIDLDVVAGYRRGLIESKSVMENRASILIVVGREDTGGLEAQIRGSKHAWDIRLISVDSLLRMLELKEELEDPQTLSRIHELLFPKEFTRLDSIVDLVFSAAEDARQDVKEGDDEDEGEDESEGQEKKKFTPVNFYDACLARIQSHLQIELTRKSRVSFVSSDKQTAIICAISREYQRRGDAGYWFAFHPHQREHLLNYARGFVGFGCGSERTLLLIPRDDFLPLLEYMNKTVRADRYYWHVHLHRNESGIWARLPHQPEDAELTKYLLASAG